MITRRQTLIAGIASAVAPALASAQSTHGTTRLLVGFPPGGTSDVLARALVQKLNSGGPPFIVENKAGAGGRLAVAEMKNNPADGKTLLMSADPILVIYPHVFKKMAYNTLTDVLPVAPVASEPLGLIVGPMVPANVTNLAEFFAWCRRNPKDAAYATAAAGTTMHFLGSILSRAEKLDYLHIPHRGGAAAVQDVMGGQIASTITYMSQVVPMLGTNKLRTLAVSSAARYKRLPEVPTFLELGYREAQALVYYAIYLRAGTPAAVLAQWHGAVSAAAESPEFVATLDRLALEPMSMSQAKFAAYVHDDLRRWEPIVKASGYVADE
jgi:tripartite-type tricarboxylate transporter receptor subunit TctC